MEATINKANLYYEIHGQGDPLLMIQGWGMDITGWQSIIEPLSKVFQVIVFDNRGTGRSEVTQLSFCFSSALFANRELLAQLKDRALNPSYPITFDGLTSQFAAVAAHDRRRQLRSIMSPTLVLGAREDGIIDVSQVEALAREIPNAQIRILPGGHMYHIEYPHTFAEALIKFLGEKAYFKTA